MSRRLRLLEQLVLQVETYLSERRRACARVMTDAEGAALSALEMTVRQLDAEEEDFPPFGVDPADSEELLRLREAIDEELEWPSDESQEGGDYYEAIAHSGKRLRFLRRVLAYRLRELARHQQTVEIARRLLCEEERLPSATLVMVSNVLQRLDFPPPSRPQQRERRLRIIQPGIGGWATTVRIECNDFDCGNCAHAHVSGTLRCTLFHHPLTFADQPDPQRLASCCEAERRALEIDPGKHP